MIKRMIVVMMAVVLCAAMAQADVFGTGVNEFDIDFVSISGDTNPASGYGIVDGDYRMGTYEVTNDQWNKFAAELGVPVAGADGGYGYTSQYTGANVPTHYVGWYGAAQFVNWLNTSTGHQAAYNFTGTQGTGDYALATWSTAEADGGTNLFRHRDAFYYLPTEDEWVKAGYWNGTSLQTYATHGDSVPVAGVDSNYDDAVGQPWDVGSGSEELNGTFDMMGNIWEWMESPYYSGDYGTGSFRVLRGAPYFVFDNDLLTSARNFGMYGGNVGNHVGFRVASEVPEPCSLGLLSVGGLALIKRRRTK